MKESTKFPVFEKMDSNICCGCEACSSACPKKIITFHEDAIGFRFPDFESERCIKCYKCVEVCPQLTEIADRVEIRECYGGYALDNDLVLKSSSGGIYSCIVDWFKCKFPDGMFIGVVWTDDYKATEFIITSDMNELNRIRVSKYIQARKNHIYQKVKSALDASTTVLFTGCPCEVAALKSYLKNDYDNLYTVDMVCKGSTSEKVMREYIDMISKGNRILDLNLRAVGKRPWIPQWIKIVFVGGRELLMPFYSTPLGKAFHLLQRDACYSCKFCGKNRFSDLTLGDFHGADPNRKYYNPDGTSEIIINTIRGRMIVNGIAAMCVLEPVEYDEIAAHNPRVEHSWDKDPKRDRFAHTLAECGLTAAYREYVPLKSRIKITILTLLYKMWRR